MISDVLKGGPAEGLLQYVFHSSRVLGGDDNKFKKETYSHLNCVLWDYTDSVNSASVLIE